MSKRLIAMLVTAFALVFGGCAVYPAIPAPHGVVVGPPAVSVYGGWGYRSGHGYHRHHRHHHHHRGYW